MNKFTARIDKLRSLFSDYDIEAIYVNKPENVSYFTGTKGNDCFLYITKDKAYIITDFRYKEMIEALTWFEFKELKAGVNTVSILKSFNETKIGVEKESLPLSDYLDFNEKIKSKTFIPVSGLVETLRETKDEDEIAYTKKACEIACKTFEHMLSFLGPGLTEKECAAELEYTMRKLGADGTSFDTILITGKKTSLPHGVPGDEKIEIGDFVTMDFGCKFNGYCSDMTRTVAIGKADDEMKKVYNIVLEAQKAACDNIKAGMTGQEIDAIARNIIEKYGYGQYFGHSLGHGTGLEIHENPRYAPTWDKPIPEGSIMSIEPGIYLPKKFGVRIEDLALVTKNGIINFVTAPKELLIL